MRFHDFCFLLYKADDEKPIDRERKKKWGVGVGVEWSGVESRQPSAHLPNLLLCVLSRRMGEDGCGKG